MLARRNKKNLFLQEINELETEQDNSMERVDDMFGIPSPGYKRNNSIDKYERKANHNIRFASPQIKRKRRNMTVVNPQSRKFKRNTKFRSGERGGNNAGPEDVNSIWNESPGAPQGDDAGTESKFSFKLK
jgi:hypothetical protein